MAIFGKFVDESAVVYFYGSFFTLKNTSRRTRLLQLWTCALYVRMSTVVT